MPMRPEGREIVVATCVDDAYLPLIWPLARSIGLANGLGRPAVLHVFHTGADEGLRARLGRLRVLRLRVEVHHASVDLTNLGRDSGLPTTSYVRLHLPDLLPAEPRVLYLDADTMVKRSLGPLFDTDLRGNPVAAVPDIMQARPSVRLRARTFDLSMAEYCRTILGIPFDPARFTYANSGVLVMDLAQLRREGFVGRVMKRARDIAPVSYWQDQDALNAELAGRITLLADEWNVVPESLLVELEGPAEVQAAFLRQAQRQSIVHFAGSPKPWVFAPVPFAVHWQVLALFSPAARLMKWPGLGAYFVSRRISFARRFARTNPRAFAVAFHLWKRWQRRAA